MAQTGATFDGEVSKLTNRIVEFLIKSGEMTETFRKRVVEAESNVPEPTRASRGKSVKALKNLIKVYQEFVRFSVGTLNRIDPFLLEIKGLYDRTPEESKPELVELFSEVDSAKSIILETKTDTEKSAYETDLVMRKIKDGKNGGGGGGFLYLNYNPDNSESTEINNNYYSEECSEESEEDGGFF